MSSLDLKIFLDEPADHARTFAGCNSPLLSVDYLYIKTFKELDLVKTKLLEKEKEAEFFNSEMKMKWERLKKQQLNFLTDIQKYDQFFRENEQKIERVSEKIRSEVFIQSNYEKEIEVREKRNEYLSGILQRMETSVNQLKPYNKFLSNLVENNDKEDTEEIDNLINKFVLLSFQSVLHDQFTSTLLETEKLHSQMQQYITVKQDAFFKQANDLFHTKEEHNMEKENLSLWKNKLSRKKEELQKDNEESVLLMKWSYENVYRMMCKWKKTRPSGTENDEQKISFIGETLYELQCIVQRVRALNNKNNLSCKADSSFMTVKRLI